MISFDLECSGGHRFEGSFRDYEAFSSQLEKKMIACPLCDSVEVKRLFRGCSIQARPSADAGPGTKPVNIFEAMRIVRHYVTNNFENVGREFPEIARAMYYGAEEARNIYGESTLDEMKELAEEGISVLPLPAGDKLEQ